MQFNKLKRREFITLVGGAAAAWPLAARAQQPAMPVVGFLHPASADAIANRLRVFHRGLKEAGFVEGENVTVAYAWGDGHVGRLPTLAAELVRRRVAVIVAPAANEVALAAAAATKTIPIVFAVSEDPVKIGLVASLSRPGGNVTGVNFYNAELNAKRLELLRQLVPGAKHIALLINPNVGSGAAAVRDVEAAAPAMGLQTQVVNASTSQEIDAAFVTIGRERPDALFVTGNPVFNSRRLQLALLAAHHAIPASYASRDYPEYGGLMSYGTNVADAFRQVGVYAGRILKGAKPADLPVVQSSKFELVINHQTARILGLTVPPTLLAIADEVIE
jgi:putative tryptophan/tyrosine transport system substrate-binding protein